MRVLGLGRDLAGTPAGEDRAVTLFLDLFLFHAKFNQRKNKVLPQGISHRHGAEFTRESRQ